jgi:hypothetical protein
MQQEDILNRDHVTGLGVGTVVGPAAGQRGRLPGWHRDSTPFLTVELRRGRGLAYRGSDGENWQGSHQHV